MEFSFSVPLVLIHRCRKRQLGCKSKVPFANCCLRILGTGNCKSCHLCCLQQGENVYFHQFPSIVSMFYGNVCMSHSHRGLSASGRSSLKLQTLQHHIQAMYCLILTDRNGMFSDKMTDE